MTNVKTQTIRPRRHAAVPAAFVKLRLNEATSEPYYQQMMRQIQAMINAGELEAGVNLPSERDLAEVLRVSRTTVKAVLRRATRKRCFEHARAEAALL